MAKTGASALWGGLKELGLFSLGQKYFQEELKAVSSANGEGRKGTKPGSVWWED